jgi:hypothetical protein
LQYVQQNLVVCIRAHHSTATAHTHARAAIMHSKSTCPHTCMSIAWSRISPNRRGKVRLLLYTVMKLQAAATFCTQHSTATAHTVTTHTHACDATEHSNSTHSCTCC